MRVVIAGGTGLTGRGRLADDRRLFPGQEPAGRLVLGRAVFQAAPIVDHASARERASNAYRLAREMGA